MTISTRHSLCLLDNWLVHLRDVASRGGPLVELGHFALDLESLRFCRAWRAVKSQLRLACIDLVGWLPGSGADGDAAAVAETGQVGPLKSCTMQAIIWARPLLLLHAAAASPAGVLYTDVDVLPHANPAVLFDWVNRSRRKDVTLLTATEPENPLNTRINNTWNCGTVFADRSSVPLMRRWLADATACGSACQSWLAQAPDLGDQRALSWLLTSHADLRKQVQLIPRSVIQQCGPQLHLPAPLFAVHFNCWKRKLRLMTNVGAWRPEGPGCL